MSFTDMFRAARNLTQPPIDDIETYWTPQEKTRVSEMLACSIIGSAGTVRKGMQDLVERTGADELMIVSDVFDPVRRLQSFRIIAEVAGMVCAS
jgi:alkanesulfonate monooxygenase SsuD/methylene tetrahydromethanopterin reductase-like flavin-dependent oxidoreductase (luciferase family)